MFSSYLKRKRYTPASNNIDKTGESFLTKKTDTPSLYSLPTRLENNKNTLKLPSYSESSSSLAPKAASLFPKASEIRNNYKKAYLSEYGDKNSTKLFDDIDDKTIEDGAKLSKKAIELNIRLGKIDDSFLKSHPYLSDGLSMFYALSDKKKSKEANEARRLAYTEIKNEKVSSDLYSPRALYEKDMERIRERIEKDKNKKSYAPYRKEPEKMPSLLSDMDDIDDIDDIDLSPKALHDRMPSYTEYKDQKKKIKEKRKAEAEARKKAQEWKTPAEGTPEDIIVESQMPLTIRQEYLDKMYPNWLNEGGTKTEYNTEVNEGEELSALTMHYLENKPKVKYHGKYCLPISKGALHRVTQGFWGDTSHAGSYNKSQGKYGYDNNNFLGAVDLAAYKGTPVYSVLPGKVVYVAPQGADYHRVTVETEINGEIYYLEYLHMDKMMVQKESEIKMGTQVGTVGSTGMENNSVHLDFRVYQFKDGFEDSFNIESSKIFFDPFEFFDFDVHYDYVDIRGWNNNDYH